MKILLTGATGYIGKRLLPTLTEKGHEIYCCVRDRNRFSYTGPGAERIHLVEVDFLQPPDSNKIPFDIEIAYYLIHSMTSSTTDFEQLELRSARNFIKYLEKTSIRQVIYLSGISNQPKLSKHLSSRKKVEDVLSEGPFAVTILRTGIVVGSGSASFEIIRDLVEKLPVMVAPRWLNTRSQPLAVRDVIKFLTGVMNKKECFNQTYDIGGPDTLTYKEMLLIFAKVRGLKRHIFIVPVMTPRLSSYWLYFVTSVSYRLAVNLVDSMKIEVIARPNKLKELLSVQPISYEEAVREAFQTIDSRTVLSSWKDSYISSSASSVLTSTEIPVYGCFKDIKTEHMEQPAEKVLENIWSIGGEKGWYYANFLWKIRGIMDKMAGGVGLRRGRTHPTEIHRGDALDFWRVLIADKNQKRLVLFAEMKLPGEAWMEFKIIEKNNSMYLKQEATFRPKGLWGRVYWYLVAPFHFFIFKGMARNIVRR